MAAVHNHSVHGAIARLQPTWLSDEEQLLFVNVSVPIEESRRAKLMRAGVLTLPDVDAFGKYRWDGGLFS